MTFHPRFSIFLPILEVPLELFVVGAARPVVSPQGGEGVVGWSPSPVVVSVLTPPHAEGRQAVWRGWEAQGRGAPVTPLVAKHGGAGPEAPSPRGGALRLDARGTEKGKSENRKMTYRRYSPR